MSRNNFEKLEKPTEDESEALLESAYTCRDPYFVASQQLQICILLSKQCNSQAGGLIASQIKCSNIKNK